MKRATNQKTIKEYFDLEKDLVSKKYIIRYKIFDSTILMNIALKNENPKLRESAVKKIRDIDTLNRLINISTDKNLKEYARNTIKQLEKKKKIDIDIQKLWKKSLAHLKLKEIEQALEYYDPSTRKNYRKTFNELKEKDKLATIAKDLQNIEPVVIEPGKWAKYRIKSKRTIKGKEMEITHYLYFQMTLFGWRIVRF